MRDRRHELLDELHQQLEQLIAALEGEVSEEAFTSLWAGCEATFVDFKGAQEARAGEELPADLRARMETVMRMQAVVSTMAVRLRDELEVEADKVSGARARIESLDGKNHVGKSCDISG